MNTTLEISHGLFSSWPLPEAIEIHQPKIVAGGGMIEMRGPLEKLAAAVSSFGTP